MLNMQETCTAAKSLVSDRNSTPAVLLHRTESLLQELSVTDGKAGVVARFVRDYQLDATDAETITTGDIDESFFSALERVHRVHENCRLLLHTHHQRAGLELLDSMASYEESAYERLCKCVIFKFAKFLRCQQTSFRLSGMTTLSLCSQTECVQFHGT